MFEIFVLGYILDNGINNVKEITDEDIEEFRKEKQEYEDSLKGTNKFPVMTVEFQVAIIERAREVCKAEKEVVMTYIKKGMRNFKWKQINQKRLDKS